MNWYMRFKQATEEWKQFNRQRQLPFMGQPDNPYLRNVQLDITEDGFDNENLYHVTTNLRGIMTDQRLKSRRELGNNTPGLGGGFRNEAPGSISLTHSYAKALDIYHDFHYIAELVRGRVTKGDIYQRLSNFVEDSFEGRLTNFDRVIIHHGVPRKIVRNGNVNQIIEILNKSVSTPEERYRFYQELELAVTQDNHIEDRDTIQTVPTSMFTADFYHIKNIDQSQIAIIQCVVRKNASFEQVPSEMEVRFNPSDVAIIRYMQPPIAEV